MTNQPAPERRSGAAGVPQQNPDFERLLHFLKESRAFDFTGYKRLSLMRRFRHRMAEVGVGSFVEYLDHLQVHPEEFTPLFNSILINVTAFFRDPDSWHDLETDILPALLNRRSGEPVRVWSAGCSAGQEAYSIAMVLHKLIVSDFRDRVKIYATDVDEDALNYARQGSYTEREARSVPAEFREKYLEPVGDRYVVRPELRRSVIFGRNDLANDAPISRIDILLCRNSLMYFNAETQSRIISRLGFALRPDGLLFLGKAEMLLTHGDVFEPFDLRRRFFRKISSDPVAAHERATGRASPALPPSLDNHMQLRNAVLAESPLAQIAVALDGRLAVVSQKAQTFLHITDRDLGRPFQDLDVSYRPVELRSQVNAVIASRVPIMLRQVEWVDQPSPLSRTYVDIQLVPLLSNTRQLIGVAINFTDVTHSRALQDQLEMANHQLETAYEELQSTNEELETTNEELQSTVEELETTNEELQSTNEELETMNEELQSTNDELQFVNEQLRLRSEDLSNLSDFMLSILGSLSSAVVVVDKGLIIQVWTRQAQELWGVREAEAVGQHLLNIDSGLPGIQLLPALKSVISGRPPDTIDRLEVINRRGRAIALQVTVSSLTAGTGEITGALLIMHKETESGGSDSVDAER